MSCFGQSLMSIVSCLIIVCVLSLRFYYQYTSGRCTSNKKMRGKTVLITGGNTGIGYSAARDIASRGARIILACRSKERAEKAKESLIEETNNKNIFVKIVDVSDLNSVRKFCKEIQATEKRLDVLINNAGITHPHRAVSAQGYELTLATNYYGSFLMTMLLLDLLKKSGPSRIINVSSVMHKINYLDLEDLHFKRRSYGPSKAYAQTKLCQILFTKELSHKLIGTGVTVNALHPGVVATEIFDKHGSFIGTCLKEITRFTMKNSDLGAQTTIYLAVADEVRKISGEYFADCKIAEVSKPALDSGLAKKLWERTEKEVGFSYKF